MDGLEENVILAPHTTFGVGGPARFFAVVGEDREMEKILRFSLENKMAFFVLGGGSNVLISDKGFDGIVIKITNSDRQPLHEIRGSTVRCEAGMDFQSVVDAAAKNDLSGLEWAAGIPGKLGGAIRGNAGAYGGEMKDIVQRVTALETRNGNMCKVDFDRDSCEFGYRTSFFKKNPQFIILSVVMKLEKGSRRRSEEKMSEIRSKRHSAHPQEKSAGSFFQNPVVNDSGLIAEFEKEKRVVSRGGKLPAAWIIQKAGLQGKRIGGAKISEKHANFIINTGTASADDVMILSSLVKQKVRAEWGIRLKEEVQFVGF